MFSFTWLFRLWSKNHSNFNRLWISPSFFTAKRDLPLISGRLHSGTPTEILQTVIRELQGNGVGAAKHQQHGSLSSLQTDTFTGVCLFVSVKSGAQMMCEDLCSELYFLQLLDLVKITEFSVIYTSKPI